MQTKLNETGRKQVNCFEKYQEANASGITLVALVVTIIVLLILAGVSINLVARKQRNFRKGNKGSKYHK